MLLAALTASAQIKVDVPNVVGIGEQFNITFTLSEKASHFEWTPGDNFQLVWGPQTGSSTSITMVNGKTTRNSQYTYTYVLMPKVKGTFSLPAAHATVGGNDLYSSSPKIEVVGDGASSQGQGSASSSAGESSQSQRRSSQGQDQEIFMRLTLSRTSAVVGEPINATLKLYTRGAIAGFEDAKFPSFNGFWSQEVEAPQNIEFRRESLGDKIYNTAVLRRWVLIPQKTGVINIDAAELVCLVQQRISSGNSIFDGFFDDYQTIRKRVNSSAYSVTVSPLPSGAPASFTGAVGSYRISAALSKDSLKVHDAASLSITVSGTGNVALVGAPKPVFPPDSEVYDTKTSERMDAGSGGTSGSKTFEYPFIPRSHGDFVIEPVEFTYYDISKRKYVTISTPELPFNVAPGEGTAYVNNDGGVNIPTSNRKEVRTLGEDIHYITTRMPKLSSQSTFLIGTGLFWGLLAGLVLLAVAVYFIASKLRKDRSDVALVRTRGASKMARKRLASAGQYLEKNLYSAFYEELHKALLGYAADKLNMGASELGKESIAASFREAGAPDGLITEYVALLDACEFARYAPDSGNAAMQESYDKAMTVISSLDANMKKKSASSVARAIILALMLMPATSAWAQPSQYVDSLWNTGVAAYADADYVLAQKAFTDIEALGLSSPELYTNIADCCYKNRDVAHAILYYERALRLDPSHKDARYNLEIAMALTQDRIEAVPEFFLKTWCRKLCYSLSSNTWTVLFILLFSAALALVLTFLLSRGSAARKAGFFGAIAAICLSIPCAVNAGWQKSDYLHRDSAIVVRPVSSTKNAPSGTSDLFVLHEGTKVRILDTVGDWTRISIADGREGWIRSNDIEII